MEYTNLTKAELLEKLNEQKHLAQAVEAKDNEIATIKKQLEEMKTKYQGAVIKSEEAKDNEIATIKKQLEEIKTKYQGAITKSEIEDYTKKVEEERKQAFEIANLYIKAHRDFLKQTQQNLEMVIFTEELLSQKIKT